MPQYKVNGTDLTDIADAIRARGDTSEQMVFPAGFISRINGIPWDWKGKKINQTTHLYSVQYALADTLYNTWTPSTTAKAIVATVDANQVVVDLSQNDALIRWRGQFIPAYNDGSTKKVQIYKQVVELWQAIFRRPNSISTINSSTFNTNVCVTFQTAPLLVYYNSSGTLTFVYTSSYGIYPTANAATFSNATADSPTITIKSPTYNARCSTTYFNTARAAELDKSNSIITMIGDMYLVPQGATERCIYEGLLDLYNNPISIT